MCFFCQAEHGIRSADVTGVQTCALPIYSPRPAVASVTPQRRRGCRASPVRPSGSGRGRCEGACRCCGRGREIGRASCRERVEMWVGGGGGRNEKSLGDSMCHHCIYITTL